MSATELVLFALLAIWVLGLSMRLARTRREVARYMPAPKPTGPLLPVPEQLRLVGTCDGEPWHSEWKAATWGPMLFGTSYAEPITYQVRKGVAITSAEDIDGYAMPIRLDSKFTPFSSDGTYTLTAQWHHTRVPS